MRYKRWADADLLRTVLALPALSAAPEGQYVTAIVRHFHTVDCIFKAHLLGVPHQYSSSNPAEPATLSALQPRVSELDDWYVDYVQKLGDRALREALQVRFTDGQEQILTRSDILLHVSLHGASHRGNVGIFADDAWRGGAAGSLHELPAPRRARARRAHARYLGERAREARDERALRRADCARAASV